MGHRALRQFTLKPSTRAVYDRALSLLEDVAGARRLSLDGKRAPDTLERFFWFHAERGTNVALGRHAFYGWLHARAVDANARDPLFEGVRRALRGWSRLVLYQVRDPLPEELVYQIGLRLVRMNFRSAGAAVALQLATYARPSEVIGLHGEDLLVQHRGSGRYNTQAVIINASIRGETSKTGDVDDTIVLDRCCAPVVGRLVKDLRAKTPPWTTDLRGPHLDTL